MLEKKHWLYIKLSKTFALNETKNAVLNILSYHCRLLSGSQSTCWSLLLLQLHSLDTGRLELVQTARLQRANLHQTQPPDYFLLPTGYQVQRSSEEDNGRLAPRRILVPVINLSSSWIWCLVSPLYWLEYFHFWVTRSPIWTLSFC